MTPEQARALLSLSFFAAFAEGGQSDAERLKMHEVQQGLGNPDVTESLRRVVFRETTPAAEASMLATPELRTMAWEMALAVCESDGVTSPAERDFLEALAVSLHRDATIATRDIQGADAVTRNATNSSISAPLPPPPSPGFAAPTSDPRSREVDESVLRYAILTAAIELLPQGLASMAIIPLQTKMVHGVGTAYGHSLSADSIKELAAAVGVGMTGQVVERYARGLLRVFGRGVFGGLGGAAANWGTGPAMTFATTYAMGMVAKQYYAGGRTLSAIDLKAIFGQQVEAAKGMYQRFEPQVQQTASQTNPMQLLQSLRG